MSVWQEFLIAAAVIVSVLTQFGDRTLNWFRVALPLLIVTGFAAYYLKALPTSGGDGWFTLGGLAVGLVTGAAAAALMTLRRVDRRIVVSTGLAYVALWVIVFGARFAFAVVATQSPETLRQVFVWSFQHGITEAGWTAAFFVQAIAMVGLRTAVVVGRGLSIMRGMTAATA